jgi:hypothetical protein
MSDTGGRRLTVRDRYFAGTEVTKIVGPIDAPTADAVRAVLAGMHADRPAAKALSRLDAKGARWRPIPGDRFRDWARDLVIDLAGEDDPEKTTVRMLAEPMGERPVLIGTGGAYPSVRFNHAVGDAAFINPFFVGALTAASTGRGGPYPLPPSTRLPLLRAALHHFSRHPGSLAAAARISRAPRIAAPATVTAPPRPWAPAMVHEVARSEAGAARRLRKWRDAHAPGASLGAVFSAAAAATVRRHLPTPALDGLFMLFDARRYLPPGRIVDGNFVVGEYVPTTDPTDVRAIHATVAERVRAGRSLAVLAVHHAGLVRAGRCAEPVPVTVPPEPRPQLALSYLGRADPYAGLPWLADYPDRTMMSLAAPGGPEAITMAIEEFGDVLHATTTYHANVFDPAAVAAATEALVGEPERLLDPADGQRVTAAAIPRPPAPRP